MSSDLHLDRNLVGSRQGLSPRFLALNAVVSISALSFLTWLVFRSSNELAPEQGWTRALPSINAGLNTMAAALLVLGWAAIRRGDRKRHRNLMASAFGCSSLFLVGYVVYHYFHGDTVYSGPARPLYLTILASHVVLSIAVVPFCLTAFFTAYRQQWTLHARVNKITLPIWLYVSVTGVVVYIFLHVIGGSP